MTLLLDEFLLRPMLLAEARILKVSGICVYISWVVSGLHKAVGINFLSFNAVIVSFLYFGIPVNSESSK